MTTTPGWYHAESDPPDTQRYWDGRAWGTEVRPAPPTATPPPPPPPPPPTPADAPSGGQFGAASATGVTAHVVDYEVIGDDLQFVEIELDPGETIIGEAGTMMYMTDGVGFVAVMGDGSQPEQGLMGKLKDAGKRAVTGEGLFLTHFTNDGAAKAKAAFAAPYPGKIVPIDLSDVGGRLICQKDAFLCAAKGARVGVAFNRKLGSGFFGGEGFILQDIQGDGLVFLQAGGTVVERRLENETLRVDTGCLVALESHIDYDIERAGNLKSMVFGGEGLFLATLTGTGRVWLQSLPFSRLADRVVSTAAYSGGNEGESSLLGGLSNVFER